MILSDVKPMHCQNVLNQMKDDYKSSTIYQTRIALFCMFSDAAEYEKNLKRLERYLLTNRRNFLKLHKVQAIIILLHLFYKRDCVLVR